MTAAQFDFAPLLNRSLPAAAEKWSGFPRFNFTGGGADISLSSTVRLVIVHVAWSASDLVNVLVADTLLPAAVLAVTLVTQL